MIDIDAVLEDFNPKSVIEEVIKQAPLKKFTKTTTGIKFEDVDFIFSITNNLEDPSILARRAKIDYNFRSPTLKKKLLEIFRSL